MTETERLNRWCVTDGTGYILESCSSRDEASLKKLEIAEKYRLEKLEVRQAKEASSGHRPETTSLTFQPFRVGDTPNIPSFGAEVLAVVQHWHTQGRRCCTLTAVNEDDCLWRFVDDNSELSHDWDVVAWAVLTAPVKVDPLT